MQENLVVALLKKEGVIDWKERNSNSSAKKFYSICRKSLNPKLVDFAALKNNETVCFISRRSKEKAIIISLQENMHHIYLIGNSATEQNAKIWSSYLYDSNKRGHTKRKQLPNSEYREKILAGCLLSIFRGESIEDKSESFLAAIFLETYFTHHATLKDISFFNKKLQQAWCYKEVLYYQEDSFKQLSKKTEQELLKLKDEHMEIRKKYYNISLPSLKELIEKTESALLIELLKKADTHVSILIKIVTEWNDKAYRRLKDRQTELKTALSKVQYNKSILQKFFEVMKREGLLFYRYSWAGVGGDLFPLLFEGQKGEFSNPYTVLGSGTGLCLTYFTGNSIPKTIITAELNQLFQAYLQENLIDDEKAVIRTWLLHFMQEEVTYNVAIIIIGVLEAGITQDIFPLLQTLGGLSLALLAKQLPTKLKPEKDWGSVLPLVQLASHLTGYMLGAKLTEKVAQGWGKICIRSRLEEAFPKLVEASNLEGGVTNFHNTIWSPGFWFQEKDNVHLGWYQAQKFHTTECEIIPTGKGNAALLCDLPSSMETKPLKF